MNTKKILTIIMAVSLAVLTLASCGKKETASSQGTNIVQNQETGEVDVTLDERTEDTQYQYDTDDLSFIDSKNGQGISIGMSMPDIEAITGEPIRKSGSNVVYNGITVQYNDENVSVGMSISGGEFDDETAKIRFKTSRGVGLGTSFEDFSKAYGNLSNERKEEETAEDGTVINGETPANAVRYFKADGNKVEYLGNSKNDDVKSTDKDKLYMQYFMFDKETNCVSAIKVTRADYLGK